MTSAKELAWKLGLLRKRSSSTKDQGLKRIKKTCQEFAYLIVIDFESTCWQNSNGRDRTQEIIEFPAILLNTSTGQIESEFHYYVQPQEHPTLSPFCRDLTGITQDQVDQGIPLAIVLRKFSTWLHTQMSERRICYDPLSSKPNKCTFVTWSDWDLAVCLHYEARRKQIRKPPELNNWVDLRATYRKFYQRRPQGLNGALQDLCIQFEGREHSGLCDARNTAKLAWRMMTDGCIIQITKSFDGSKGNDRTSVAQNPRPSIQVSATSKKEIHESSSDLQHSTIPKDDTLSKSEKTIPQDKSINTGLFAMQKGTGTRRFQGDLMPNINQPSHNLRSSLCDALQNASYQRIVPEKENITPDRLQKTRANEMLLGNKTKISNEITPLGMKSVNHFKTPSEHATMLVRKPFGTVNTMRTPSDTSMRTCPTTLYKRTPPMCECGRRTHRKVVQNPGPNQGRAFYACPIGRGMRSAKGSMVCQARKNGCRFFKWEPQDHNLSGTSPIYTMHSINQSTSGYGNTFLKIGPLAQPDFGVNSPGINDN